MGVFGNKHTYRRIAVFLDTLFWLKSGFFRVIFTSFYIKKASK
jgi:hypothetical protein